MPFLFAANTLEPPRVLALPPPLPTLPILLPPLPPSTDATATPSLVHPPPEPLPAAKLINQRTLSSSPLSAACRRGVSPFLFCTCVRLLSIAYPCCVRIELRNAVYQHVMRGGVCVYKSQADLSIPAPYVQERKHVCVCARDVSVCMIFFTIVLCESETHNYAYTIIYGIPHCSRQHCIRYFTIVLCESETHNYAYTMIYGIPHCSRQHCTAWPALPCCQSAMQNAGQCCLWRWSS